MVWMCVSSNEVILCYLLKRGYPTHSTLTSRCPILLGYGFNPGSALLLSNAESTSAVGARAAGNTSLGGAFGGLSGLFVNMLVHKFETSEVVFCLDATMNGVLAGLVGITGESLTVSADMLQIPKAAQPS